MSSAVIATSLMGASALWTPARSAAKAALTSSAPSTTVPAPPPPPPAPAVRARRAPSTAPTTDRCAAARRAVEQAGDHLGGGFEFRCPSSDYPRWGATSLLPCGECFVDINTAVIGPNDRVLRYAVAHEFCHSHGIRDEQAADDCAAGYGFPNVYFKR